MSDRKYRQSGYQDGGREAPKREQRPRAPKGSHEGPRPIRMPGFQEVLRCAMCGAVVPLSLDIEFESQCPKCKSDLRSCKNCRHFDAGARLECTEPFPERIAKKDVRNRCALFVGRKSIERETRDAGGYGGGYGGGSAGGSAGGGAPKPPRPSAGRSAFDDLFKK
jgi:hypothetical protein